MQLNCKPRLLPTVPVQDSSLMSITQTGSMRKHLEPIAAPEVANREKSLHQGHPPGHRCQVAVERFFRSGSTISAATCPRSATAPRSAASASKSASTSARRDDRASWAGRAGRAFGPSADFSSSRRPSPREARGCSRTWTGTDPRIFQIHF